MATDSRPTAKDDELTIEQLAFETGMSVRNIRNHQSRGLLPPPVVRARTGYYGPDHIVRLRLIQEMQAEGFKLSAIERLVGEQGLDTSRLVSLRQAVTAPYATETPEVLTREELAQRFGTDDERLLLKAQKLRLLIPLDEGRFEVPSPALLRAAEDVVGRGIHLRSALAAIEKLNRTSKISARAFVRLFLEELWKPFDEAGRPDEDWPEITEAIEQLRPLASEALNATFRLILTEEIEKAFGEVLERRRRS